MENIEIITTQDGSLGLYDKKLDEIFHSKTGARKEAFEKFVEPCFVLNAEKPLKILDICYGIGYNSKMALEKLDVELIDCVEINRELVFRSCEFKYCEKINKIIKNNLEKPDFINFFIGDARKIIPKLDKEYDVIFHDGFAPHKQSVLWSEDFIAKIIRLMHKNSLFCTYNHSKPLLAALLAQNLKIGKIIKNGKTISTVASFNSDLIQNPLDDYEIAQLKTKSAITYKDFNLNLSHEEIISNRKKEISASNRQTLSAFKKMRN